MPKKDLTASHHITNRQHSKIINETVNTATTVNNTGAITTTVTAITTTVTAITTTVTAIDHSSTCW